MFFFNEEGRDVSNRMKALFKLYSLLNLHFNHETLDSIPFFFHCASTTGSLSPLSLGQVAIISTGCKNNMSMKLKSS